MLPHRMGVVGTAVSKDSPTDSPSSHLRAQGWTRSRDFISKRLWHKEMNGFSSQKHPNLC